jgi:phospholipase C
MLNHRLKIYARVKQAISTLALGAALAGALVIPAMANENQKETTSPIKHVVVIFQENVSFDHYFATYPNAVNLPGEPAFKPSKRTPSVNGIPAFLMTNNPNLSNPFRLDRSQAVTCDQGHDYTQEQTAYHFGLLDQFIQSTDVATCKPQEPNGVVIPGVVMGYFDGNTVTGLWNYAQHFAMSDNHFSTSYGPSTPGAINLISGQTHGVAVTTGNTTGDLESDSVIGDPQPYYDECSTRETVGMVSSNKNVGDLLNAQKVTWGFFQGGFRPTAYDKTGKAICGASHIGSNGQPKGDYIPHHEPFQYYASTSNPHHNPPSSVTLIGQQDQANHQYDLADFWATANSHNIPAVSFLKAPGYLDGHAGYSDPIAEQGYLVNTINELQSLPEWEDMLVVISYDDSDGWYDHVMPPIVNQSNTPSDTLTGVNSCGIVQPGAYAGRCGYGPRQPLLLISPYAKKNFVDHSVTDLTSILRFIEDNWNLGRIGDQSLDVAAGSLENMLDFEQFRREPLILDPATGQRVKQ